MTGPFTRDDAALPWHEALWRRVWAAGTAGQLGHAVLLSGPPGLGKRQFAARLASALLCEAPDKSRGACGGCRGCVQVAAGTHPNLRWLAREVNERTDKLRRDISLEQLRGMMEGLSLASHYGGNRVVVIDPVDALNTAGVNALLKTLEEPPPRSHLLLITERRMALAATLRSRCQHLAFAVPDTAQARHWLEAQGEDFDVDAALALAGGAPLAALRDQQTGSAGRYQAWTRGLLDLAQRRADPVSVAAGVDKDAVAEWLKTLQRGLLQVLRCRANGEAEAGWREVTQRLGPLQIDRLLAETVQAQHRLQSNANPQLLVESLMILWWHLTSPPPTRGPLRA